MAKQNSSYVTQRFSFVGNQEQRSGAVITKDQQFINCYPETISVNATGEKRYSIKQRAGLVYDANKSPGVAGTARGIYVYGQVTYTVIGNTLYSNTTAKQVLTTSSGPIGFVEFQGTNEYLIVLDGTDGWAISTAGVVTQITDADFPSPHRVQAAFLDGYLFVAPDNSGDIYNCDLDDPFTWSPTAFITAEMFPDKIVALRRQTNYIIAFGTDSIEYFYNAGTSPGTPLARNVAAFHFMGLAGRIDVPASAGGTTLSQIGEKLVFVGQSAGGPLSVWVLDGFQLLEISDDVVKASLDEYSGNVLVGYVIHNNGHQFYVLNGNNAEFTWVYDFDEGMWHQWKNAAGNAKFNCDYSTEYTYGANGFSIFLDSTLGIVYYLNDSTSVDATGAATTANITSTIITKKIDFDTINNKTCSRFSLICDVPAASSATSCSVSWSDNDYQTYSTARTLTINDTMSNLTQLGMFRRRAFKLVYSQAYPLRVDGFELDVNIGTK